MMFKHGQDNWHLRFKTVAVVYEAQQAPRPPRILDFETKPQLGCNVHRLRKTVIENLLLVDGWVWPEMVY
jgi:hypothetical protein